MSNKAMPRGRKLLPGLAALPVSCGRTVFHGLAVFYGCAFPTVFTGISRLIQMTIHGSEWWKRSKQTILVKGWGDSTLNRRTSMLDLPNFGTQTSHYCSAFPTQPSSINIPNLNSKTCRIWGIRAS